MEKKKRLGRGLKEISHYFISDEQSCPPKPVVSSVSHVVAIIDPNAKRGALLTTEICQSLCVNGNRTLVIDTEERFPGVAYTLGCSIPGYLFSHFTTDVYNPDDLIYTFPTGLNILEPRLNIDDMNKLKTKDISSMLDILSALEKNTDFIVLRGYDCRIVTYINEALLIIENGHEPLIHAYNVIKSFIANSVNPEITDIGIIVTGTSDTLEALSIYERIKRCSESYTGITPSYCGCLPVIDKDITISPITSNLIEQLKVRRMQKEKKQILFFEKLKTLVTKGHISEGELAALSNKGIYP